MQKNPVSQGHMIFQESSCAPGTAALPIRPSCIIRDQTTRTKLHYQFDRNKLSETKFTDQMFPAAVQRFAGKEQRAWSVGAPVRHGHVPHGPGHLSTLVTEEPICATADGEKNQQQTAGVPLSGPFHFNVQKCAGASRWWPPLSRKTFLFKFFQFFHQFRPFYAHPRVCICVHTLYSPRARITPFTAPTVLITPLRHLEL